jgi:hypothetical protein
MMARWAIRAISSHSRCRSFAVENALAGGVTISLARDIHGKSYSNVRRAIELPDPK